MTTVIHRLFHSISTAPATPLSRSAIRMGLRQMFVGALAAAVTYGVGHLIGAHVS